MALLQRSCVSGCAAPVNVPFTALLLHRAATVRLQAPKSVRLSICRASSENGSADVLPQEEAPMIFKDESNGIICYYDENGDLTCEGWDEGPHFQPDLQQPSLRRRRRFTPRAIQGRGGGETVIFKNIKGRMGESIREVANESLECSEL